MTKLGLGITMSLDGYVAGPRQGVDDPLGEGGERLHDWLVATRTFHAMPGKEGGATGPDDEVSPGFVAGTAARTAPSQPASK